MSDPRCDDLVLTHGILNVLNAGFQGRLVARDFEAQLARGVPDAAAVEASKETLGRIRAWAHRMWEGECLLACGGRADPSPDAPAILELLDDLRGELVTLPRRVRKALARADLGGRPDDARLLVSALGRAAYAREHYLNWLVGWGDRFGPAHVADRWRQHLPSAQEQVREVHAHLEAFRKPDAIEIEHVRGLHDAALILPGAFSSQLHDMSVLIGTRHGRLTYGMTGIRDAAGWRRLGMEAEPAGYWHAHGFTPGAAQEWSELGFVDAAAAAVWMVRGFGVVDALRWANAGFGPAEAKHEWDLGGRSPGAARAQLVAARRPMAAAGAAQASRPVSPPDVAVADDRWDDEGFDGEQVDRWRAQGFERASEAGRWHRAGIEAPRAARAWRDRGLTAEDAALFTSLQEFKAWRAEGLGTSEAIAWKRTGCRLSEAKRWRENGIRTAGAAAEWKQARIGSPREAGEWVRAGYYPGKARVWLQEGFSTEEALGWLRHGFSTAEEALKWRARGHPDPAAARQATCGDPEYLQAFILRLIMTARGTQPRQILPLLGSNYGFINPRFPATFRKVVASLCPDTPERKEIFAQTIAVVAEAVRDLPAGNPRSNARVGEQCLRILGEIVGL